MKHLEREYYKTVIPVLKRTRKTPIFAYAVCDGIIAGSIFVNSTEQPGAGMIATQNGIYHIFGDASHKEFQRQLFSYIQNEVLSTDKRFTLFLSEVGWEDLIHKRFTENLISLDRKKFLFQKDLFENRKAQLQEEHTYKVLKVEEQIVSKSEEFLVEYYEEYWGSVQTFLRHGFGFCALDGEKIVSECTSIFRSNQFAEIDIVTGTSYQGKGLARLVAIRFIEHCIDKGVTPCWDCDSRNVPSQKLASKLGFVDIGEYKVYVRKNRK